MSNFYLTIELGNNMINLWGVWYEKFKFGKKCKQKNL